MKVLFVGTQAGFYARDDATVEALGKNPAVTTVVVIGGNARTALLPKTRNVPHPNGGRWTLQEIVQVAIQEVVDFAVVGADEPLGAGLVDMLEEAGIPTFGPNEKAAQLEASKSWAIELMREAGIPHPESQIFTNQAKAFEFAQECDLPIVAKIDCFAGGKGVDICKTRGEVVAAVADFIRKYPGKPIIFQELLVGVEVSVFCFTDGEHISEVVAACDYKPRFDGDQGPNTGSMGSFSPPRFWSDRLAEWVKRTILRPIVDIMRRKGILYRGVIYAGLMLTSNGPKVLEFNCRLGDSEGQVILLLLESDLLDVMLACRAGTLNETPVVWNRQLVAGTVVLVDENYPGSIGNNGERIDGLDRVGNDVIVYHYGTKLVQDSNGSWDVALGGSGRRLSVTAVGTTHEEVFRRIYNAIPGISFPGKAWRADIGKGRDLPEEWAYLYA